MTTSPVSTAASLTASKTSTWATSDTELTTEPSSESARSETIQTSISVPREGLDVVRRGDAGDRLTELGERGEDHVGAHGRDLDVVRERGADLDDATAVGELREVDGRLGGCLGLLLLLVLGVVVVADEALEAGDQRLRLDLLLAALVDRVDRGREGVEALEQDVDRRARQAALALAQQLEDILHLVRQGRHAGEAHRRAHALQRVRDPEDLVDRVLVVGPLFDADDRKVELLEVLAPLGQEHREVVGRFHYGWLFR